MTDFNRRIINAEYERESQMARVDFGSTEEEEGALLRGDTVVMCAWVVLADEGDYILRVTSDDPRLSRIDVRTRILKAYNAAWCRLYELEDVEFVIDPECFRLG